MKIPLVDLKRQYLSIKKPIDDVIQQVLLNSSFILGEHVIEFENNFAKYCGSKYCVGLNSGTDALFFSFLSLGLRNGDEVITTANTFFATTEYLGHLKVKPVFVDIDPETYLIDVNKIESAITEKTKAIIVVHLYGQSVDMDEVMNIAKKYNLYVIEDCAQSHGAEYKGKKLGTIGDIGAYSFYPGKNLGAYGDAGCIITNREEISIFVKKLRNHGRVNKYKHDIEAYSSRMDGIQAAILNVKLSYLDNWIEKRRLIATKYNKLLNKKIKIPFEKNNNKHAYHLYVISVDDRDGLLEYLKINGIEAGIHYPIPLHLQPAYKYLNFESLPITEMVSNNILSLPIFPELTDEEICYITDCINNFID